MLIYYFFKNKCFYNICFNKRSSILIRNDAEMPSNFKP